MAKKTKKTKSANKPSCCAARKSETLKRGISIEYTGARGARVESIAASNAYQGDLMVWSPWTDKVAYFDGHESKDTARYAFAKKTGVQFSDTRIKTVKRK